MSESPASVPPDSEAVRLRIAQGLPLVERIARQVGRRYRALAEQDELVSMGYEGLCAAARTFDPSYGVPFERYAWRRIHGFIMNGAHKGARHAYLVRMRGAASQAATLLDDTGSAADPDSVHFGTLQAYCDAVAAAMALSLMGGETAAMATTDPEERLRQGELKAMVGRALGAIDPELAGIAVAHLAEERQLKALAAEQGTSYRTMRRRHNRALLALGKAVRAQHGAASADENLRSVAAPSEPA